MIKEQDFYLYRSKQKTFISILKIIIVGLIFLSLFLSKEKLNPEMGSGSAHVGLIHLNEIIFENDFRDKKIAEITENKDIKALIIKINSPGGSAAASEKLYRIIEKVKLKIPVVTCISSLGASGGYMLAVTGERIFAYDNSITGSIGVIMQSAEIVKLAEKIGVDFYSFKSSPLKATPNPLERLTPEIERATMAVINDAYNSFVELVSKARNLPREYVLEVADGRIYTGKQALTLKLIDEIGGEDEALLWLEKENKIEKGLEISEYSIKPKFGMLEQILQNFSWFQNLESKFFKGLLTLY